MSKYDRSCSGKALPILCASIGLALIALTSPIIASAGYQANEQTANEQTASVAQQASSSQAGKNALDGISQTFEAAAKKVNPSVVTIFSEATVAVRNPFGGGTSPLQQFFGDQFLQRYFGYTPGQQQGQQRERTVRALGSGVISSSDGYILTNNHVVEGATKLTVVLPDGDRKPAKVIGTDAETDLALIKVDAHDLPAATFGDSDNLHIGQWVIAVGNPFGLMHTTTAGIISALGRSQVHLNNYEDFIQTDAAINPGNSGGPLADLDGRVIGINSAISTPSGGSVGLGFAIPINLAKHVMQQLKEHGKVIRGFLGVVLQPLTSGLAEALGINEDIKGVLIGDVEADSPADEAGLEQADVVTKFNGEPVTSVLQLRNLVANTAPDTEVKFTVFRKGQTLELDATLGQRQANASGASGSGPGSSPAKLGLVVQTLTPDIAQQLGYQGETGAVVTQVQPGSAAATAGLRRGDLITSVNREPVKSAQDLSQAIRGLESGSTAALLVQRENNSFYVAIEIP